MTRFEKIKSMSVEELATFLDNADSDKGFLMQSCVECPDHTGDYAACQCEHCHEATVAYLNKEAEK